MGASRGDSSVTRKLILSSARELFAAHGVDGVSVRDIAAAAGVNHALVHRYFGTKREMVAEILKGEASAMDSMTQPEADAVASLETLREILTYALSGGRTSLLLMLRAGLDGLAPERLLEGAPSRPVGLLADWFERQGPGRGDADPRVTAMVLGAAVLGLAAVQPMLAAGAGLEGEDPAAVSERCVDVLVGLAAGAIETGQDTATDRA